MTTISCLEIFNVENNTNTTFFDKFSTESNQNFIEEEEQYDDYYDDQPHIELGDFTSDLTLAAELGLLDPLIGRDQELDRMIRILCRRTKNNPVIIGEPGVGKTALVEGLAQKIINEEVPRQLLGATVLTVDLGALVAGTRYRGEFEERLQMLIDHAQSDPDTIIFIDEIHTLIGAGSAEGTMDAANMLKPALSRGKLRCIGATTTEEYKKYIERDAALERRFQPVRVDPPSVASTVRILCRLRGTFESFHGVAITNETLVQAVELADRYIPDRFLPDKAIDALDEACAYVAMRSMSNPPGIKPFYSQLSILQENKDQQLRKGDFYSAARTNEEEEKVRLSIVNYQDFYDSLGPAEKSTLRENKEFLQTFIQAMQDQAGLDHLLEELRWIEKQKAMRLAELSSASMPTSIELKQNIPVLPFISDQSKDFKL